MKRDPEEMVCVGFMVLTAPIWLPLWALGSIADSLYAFIQRHRPAWDDDLWD